MTNMFIHEGWGHFAGNMRVWIPVGTVMTWLTSNRHVFVVVVTAHVLANFVAGAAGQLGVGSSSAALAVVAAALVRSAGYTLQNASVETLQSVVAGLLGMTGCMFFLIFLAAGGGTDIAHFHHFLGFLFGGAIEAIFVFGNRKSDTQRRTLPRQFSR